MTNTDIVKGMYAAFGSGDVAGVLNALAEDVNWTTPGSKAVPFAGNYRGRAAVAGFFQKLGETTEIDPFQFEQFIEQGDTVVVLGSETGRSKATKKGYQSRWAMVFKFRDGKVATFEEYQDTAAIESAFAPAMAARS